MKLRRIYRLLYWKIIGRLRPTKFAQKVGVNISDISKLYIYGIVTWGTEPWLISIGENVHLTNGVKFITHDGGTLLYRSIIPDLEITKPISIGHDVYIGNDVIILPGVSIGNNVIIGAGAIVSKNIPDNSVAVGVPAKVIKSANEYLNKIKQESLHLGHLAGEEKDKALKQFYHYTGTSKGIYF